LTDVHLNNILLITALKNCRLIWMSNTILTELKSEIIVMSLQGTGW